MPFVPFLQNLHLGAADAHVQFDVGCEAGAGQVGRADQSEGADDFLASVGEVRLCVKLIFSVHAALDLAVRWFEGLGDGRDAGEEVVLFLLGLDALVEALRLRDDQN